MRKAMVIVAAGALACAALTGCSGSDSEPEANSSPSTTAAESSVETPSAPATPTATPAQAAVKDAAALADALRAQIPEITGVTVYDETNDPNDLIGRPNQYTSAAALADPRAGGGDGIDQGAVVEVFAAPADAQARSDYIQDTLKSLGPAFGTEWHYVNGASLLRVSGTLPPSVNEQYAAAWSVVTSP